MSLSGLGRELKKVSPFRFLKKKGAFGLFETDAPGAPPVQEDPQVALEREATDSAIAGDIATRNVQQRSSTLGEGAASRFLQTSTVAGQELTGQTAANLLQRKKPKKIVI